MPYCVGAGDPEWDEYRKLEEDGQPPRRTLMKYAEPWEAGTAVASFPETPGPEPEVPPENPYPVAPVEIGIGERQPGVIARLFMVFARLLGKNSAPMTPQAQNVPEGYWDNWVENWQKRQSALRAHDLWKVSSLAVQCRALGVKRIYGRYDGGGDESFTYLYGAEMSDGRKIAPDALPQGAGIDFEQLFEMAIFAIMGSYDAGEFVLCGAAVVDFEACSITDEKNADVVFADDDRTLDI